MIRRGFWLLTGAALGVSGYRKATRLTRTLTGQPGGRQPGGRQLPGSARPLALPGPRPTGDELAPAAAWPARLIAGTRAASGFIRDVRIGMADYRELHGRGPGRSLGSQRDRARPGASERGHLEP
jgi:hypothetical protein